MREIRFVPITYYSLVQFITRFVISVFVSVLFDYIFIMLSTDLLLKCVGITCLAQLHDFDMCVAKNEEALRIEPHFAECYGNMANAWKVSHHF
jgi:hypothetical protein